MIRSKKRSADTIVRRMCARPEALSGTRTERRAEGVNLSALNRSRHVRRDDAVYWSLCVGASGDRARDSRAVLAALDALALRGHPCTTLCGGVLTVSRAVPVGGPVGMRYEDTGTRNKY